MITVTAVNSTVLWKASSRNSGRLACSPNVVSTKGMPSSTELPKAEPKPMIAWRSNAPPKATRAAAMPMPNTSAKPRKWESR